MDERHEASRRFYRARDLAGYMSLFAPDLAYRQANGATIDLKQLTNQVADQLRRLGAADWTSRVESEERANDSVVEVITQNGIFVATAFGVVHRAWRFERRGRYTWRVHEGRWRIAEVQVLEERIQSAGFQFGRRPSLGSKPSGTDPD